MAPFDPNSLAGILGMQNAQAAPIAPLGMKPPFDTGVTPGFVGINGQGLTGAELPGLEGLSQIPGHDTMMGAAQAGNGADLKLGGASGAGPMAAILGMEALKALSSPPPQQQVPHGSTSAAPRGQQVSVKGAREALPVNSRKGTIGGQ
jgi:hypothetical protein